MANFPANCEIGKTYYYGPTFLSSFWDVLGGDFTFGSTIETPTSGTDLAWAWKSIPNVGGLKVKMTFDYLDNGGGSVGGAVAYNSLILGPGTTSTATAPHAQLIGPFCGAGMYRSFACFSSKFSWYVFNKSASGCTLNTNQMYSGNTITITVSEDKGGNKYDVTVRLEMPGAGVDETQVYVDGIQTLGAKLGLDGAFAYGTNTFKITGMYIIGHGLPDTCEGKTIYPWPTSIKTGYPSVPAACDLGKNTSWYLEQFGSLSRNWTVEDGDFHTENGMASLPIDIDAPMDTLLQMKWAGKLLYFDAGDHLSLRLGGRIDDTNTTDELGVYDALSLQILFPDLSSTALIAVRRDSGDPSVYQIATEESYGGSNLWTPSPALVTYPFEVELRIDVYVDRIDYFLNEVLLTSAGVPGSPLYVYPTIIAGADNLHRGYFYYFYTSGSPGFKNLCAGSPSERVSMYREEMLNLLPTGPLWRNLNFSFRMFMEAFAVEFARIHDLILTLLRESNPAQSTSALLLSQWEDQLLLPEEKPVGTESEVQRQRVVNAKLITSGGQSIAFFKALAANFGLGIDITEGGYWTPARVGIARVGTARTNAPGSVFIWNIRFLIDVFEAPTAYWTYDGDENFATYPGYLAVQSPASSTYVVFKGGELFLDFPITGFTDPVTVAYSLRCIYGNVINESFMLMSWSSEEDFSTDYVFFDFNYQVTPACYCLDMFGTKNGVPYSDLIETGIALSADVTFDILVRITPTGFTISIPSFGFSHSQTGFVFDNLKYLDFNLQRPTGVTQGMLGSLGISSDAQVSKFKLAVERLKPAHTQVTFN